MKKNTLYTLSTILLIVILVACSSTQNTTDTPVVATSEEALDTIRIASDETEYEIIVMETGFNNWLLSQQPRGFYNQDYLERRNQVYTAEYNRRVLNSTRYGDLYPQQIPYDATTDYGYEVNYMLYNYYEFFQQRYNQRLF